MLGLAKEIGLVGGDRVQQMLALRHQIVAVEQPTAIIAQAAMAVRPYATTQPPFDHRDLHRWQTDTAFAVHIGGDSIEIAALKRVGRVQLTGQIAQVDGSYGVCGKPAGHRARAAAGV